MRFLALLFLAACSSSPENTDGGSDAGDASTTCNVVIVVCEIGYPCPSADAGAD